MGRAKRFSRRELIRSMLALPITMASVVLSACKQVVEVKVVEKEVTKVVRETVIVVPPPRIIEKTVEKVITAAPASRPVVVITADVMTYGWTQFAISKSLAFQEMFPNITMRWRNISGWRDYPRLVATLQAGNQLGDLLEAPLGALMATWLQRGIIQPLDEIIQADGFDTSGIFKSAMRACRHQDKYAGLPFLANAGENVLLYQKRLFGEARIAYPTTDWNLDALSKAGAALTKDRDGDGKIDQFGYPIQYTLPSAYPMLRLFEAHLFSADGKQCLLESESGMSCLRWAYQQIYDHRAAAAPPQIEQGALRMFQQGKLSMVRGSLRTLFNLNSSADDRGQIGAVLYPKHPITGKRGTCATGMAYCMTSRTRNPIEVFQWLKFMSGREMGVQIFFAGHDPGCRMASWKDPRVVELYPLCTQIADAADVAEVERLPWNLRLSDCLDIWNRELTPLWFGESTPQETAARISRAINRILARPMLESHEVSP